MKGTKYRKSEKKNSQLTLVNLLLIVIKFHGKKPHPVK